MSNRNQHPYNPNNYPHQPYGHFQPGSSTRSHQDVYQTNQQQMDFVLDPSHPSYTYPVAPGGAENYAMAPTFPMPQGGSQGYAIPGSDIGQYAVTQNTTPWDGGSPSPVFHGNYQMGYPSVDHMRPYTPSPPTAQQGWQYPMVRPSTPQAQAPRQSQQSQHNRSISLVEATGMPHGENTLDPSGKHKCPHCPSLHARKSDVQRHIRSVHTNEARYQCLACGEGFPRSDARGLHWKNYPGCKALHLQKGGV